MFERRIVVLSGEEQGERAFQIQEMADTCNGDVEGHSGNADKTVATAKSQQRFVSRRLRNYTHTQARELRLEMRDLGGICMYTTIETLGSPRKSMSNER